MREFLTLNERLGDGHELVYGLGRIKVAYGSAPIDVAQAVIHENEISKMKSPIVKHLNH